MEGHKMAQSAYDDLGTENPTPITSANSRWTQ
jgi:hypothetical protein